MPSTLLWTLTSAQATKKYANLYPLWFEGMPRFHRSFNPKDKWWAEYVDVRS